MKVVNISCIEILLIFLLGVVLSFFVMSLNITGIEMPFGINFYQNYNEAPKDWIKGEDITVQEDKIVIDVKNASISRYADTGSMLPVLDENANGIRIKPESEADIDVGDIVTYRSDGKSIVHRVIEKGVDNEGIYFIMKGDNNDFSDGKIRFKDVEYVTIGVLY